MLAAIVCACALSGCTTVRYRVGGEEAAAAVAFFRGAARVTFPVVASFSGSAELSGGAVPFVAAVNARGPSEEILGFYDPLGRGLAFLENDGARVTVLRGPAAGNFPPAGMEPVAAGALSIGRIVSGAPGYAVAGGEVARTADGAWVLRDGRQTLFSDPGRTLLSRAEYDVYGRRITVTYPDRLSPGPAPAVKVELRGARILLRRDLQQ
jgi:hypothetical protein